MKGVLKLVAKPPAGPPLLLARFVPLSGLLKSRREGEQLALRQSVCCSLGGSVSCARRPSPRSSLLSPHRSAPACLACLSAPPRHTLSLSLLLCFCNLFVSASSGFLFPPSSSSFVASSSSLRTVPVRQSPSASYRTSLAHTPARRCISLTGGARTSGPSARTCDTGPCRSFVNVTVG